MDQFEKLIQVVTGIPTKEENEDLELAVKVLRRVL